MHESHALILAGGFGTRLWPLSRKECPKQFMPVLAGNRSLLQETFDRLSQLFDHKNIWLIAKPEHKEEIFTQLPQLLRDRLILEPSPKGTLAAISWATTYIAESHGDVVIGAFPTDHYIVTSERFHETIRIALNWASTHDHVVLFGIVPNRAESNYGYIEKGLTLETIDGQDVVNVASFHEKPSIDLADQYIRTGNFLWNSGIFVFRAHVLLNTIKLHDPHLYDQLRQLNNASNDLATRITIYDKMPDTSIDKGLVEHIQNTVVLPCRWQWADIGLWTTCYALMPKDENGNVILGKVLQKDCYDCLIRNEDKGLIAMVGMHDIVVVQKGDVTLICPKDMLAAIPELLEELKKQGLDVFL